MPHEVIICDQTYNLDRHDVTFPTLPDDAQDKPLEFTKTLLENLKHTKKLRAENPKTVKYPQENSDLDFYIENLTGISDILARSPQAEDHQSLTKFFNDGYSRSFDESEAFHERMVTMTATDKYNNSQSFCYVNLLQNLEKVAKPYMKQESKAAAIAAPKTQVEIEKLHAPRNSNIWASPPKSLSYFSQGSKQGLKRPREEDEIEPESKAGASVKAKEGAPPPLKRAKLSGGLFFGFTPRSSLSEDKARGNRKVRGDRTVVYVPAGQPIYTSPTIRAH